MYAPVPTRVHECAAACFAVVVVRWAVPLPCDAVPLSSFCAHSSWNNAQLDFLSILLRNVPLVVPDTHDVIACAAPSPHELAFAEPRFECSIGLGCFKSVSGANQCKLVELKANGMFYLCGTALAPSCHLHHKQKNVLCSIHMSFHSCTQATQGQHTCTRCGNNHAIGKDERKRKRVVRTASNGMINNNATPEGNTTHCFCKGTTKYNSHNTSNEFTSTHTPSIAALLTRRLTTTPAQAQTHAQNATYFLTAHDARTQSLRIATTARRRESVFISWTTTLSPATPAPGSCFGTLSFYPLRC